MTTAQQLQQTMNNFRIMMENQPKPNQASADDFCARFGNAKGNNIFYSFLKKTETKKRATA